MNIVQSSSRGSDLCGELAGPKDSKDAYEGNAEAETQKSESQIPSKGAHGGEIAEAWTKGTRTVRR